MRVSLSDDGGRPPQASASVPILRGAPPIGGRPSRSGGRVRPSFRRAMVDAPVGRLDQGPPRERARSLASSTGRHHRDGAESVVASRTIRRRPQTRRGRARRDPRVAVVARRAPTARSSRRRGARAAAPSHAATRSWRSSRRRSVSPSASCSRRSFFHPRGGPAHSGSTRAFTAAKWSGVGPDRVSTGFSAAAPSQASRLPGGAAPGPSPSPAIGRRPDRVQGARCTDRRRRVVGTPSSVGAPPLRAAMPRRGPIAGWAGRAIETARDPRPDRRRERT